MSTQQMETQGQPAPAEQVETPAVETPVTPSVETPETPAEDVEPDEADYADPAEYKKALREHIANKTRKEEAAARKRELEGLLGEVKRQRQGKRALARQLEAMAEYVQGIDQKVSQFGQQPSALQEPQPHDFQTPQDYAKAYGAWVETQSRNQQPQQPAVPREQPAPADNGVWNATFAATVQSDPSFAALVQKQAVEKIGADMAGEAVSAMMSSPVGINIYRYLVSNPDVTEDIEDMSKAQQVQAIKLLERNLMSRAWAPASAAPAQAPVAQPVVAQPVQKPAVPPPPPAPAAAPRTAPKRPQDAKSMAEYHRLRMAELRGQKRR